MSENTNNEPAALTGSPSDTADLAPIDSAKRIDALDILRGFALLGILLMNIEWFGRSLSGLGSFDPSLTGLDHAVGWLVRCFIEGKFYKLFALLFGMGFAVMLIRAKEVGRPFGLWFTRRMFVLFAIGILHMVFLWGGDILHDYAVTGMALLGLMLLLRIKWLRRFDNPRSMLKLALGWLSFPFVASTIAALVFGLRFDATELEERWEKEQTFTVMLETRMAALEDQGEDTLSADEPELNDTESAIEAESPPSEEVSADVAADPGTMVVEDAGSPDDTDSAAVDGEAEPELSEEEQREKRIQEIIERRQESDADDKKERDVFSQSTYWEATRYRWESTKEKIQSTPFFALIFLMPIFLLGYWLIASGRVQNYQQNRHIFKPMAWIGMVFGLFFTIAGLTIVQHPAHDEVRLFQATGQTLFFAGQYILCAGYLGLLITLLGSERWLRWLGKLAPVGRMALTNYIMHSLILTTIFYGYAGGLFGQVSRAPQMLIVLAIIIFQIYLSRWWLKHFRFGPLEWLWRSMTYMKLQPMKIG